MRKADNPRVIDNDKGTITVLLEGKELRGWCYASPEGQRQKISQAREYVEGWCECRERINAPLVMALQEAERFMDYFAGDRTSFEGSGTPMSCLTQIREALAALKEASNERS